MISLMPNYRSIEFKGIKVEEGKVKVTLAILTTDTMSYRNEEVQRTYTVDYSDFEKVVGDTKSAAALLKSQVSSLGNL